MIDSRYSHFKIFILLSRSDFNEIKYSWNRVNLMGVQRRAERGLIKMHYQLWLTSNQSDWQSPHLISFSALHDFFYFIFITAWLFVFILSAAWLFDFVLSATAWLSSSHDPGYEYKVTTPFKGDGSSKNSRRRHQLVSYLIFYPTFQYTDKKN